MRSLSSSASRIIAASKPTPAMTAKRSSSKRPTSRRRRRSVQADVDGLLEVRRDAEVGGEQVRRPGREDGQATHRRRRARRRSAGRCRRRPRRTPGPRPPPARARPARAPAWPSAPHTTADRLPLSLEHAAQLRQPAAERLSACATTATFMPSARARRDSHRCRGSGRLRRTAAPGGAAGEEQHQQRADADEHPAGDIERMVHAAVHARRARRTIGEQSATAQAAQAQPAVADRRSEQQHEPGVDRDRRCGMAGRVAGVRRQVLETLHVGRSRGITREVTR